MTKRQVGAVFLTGAAGCCCDGGWGAPRLLASQPRIYRRVFQVPDPWGWEGLAAESESLRCLLSYHMVWQKPSRRCRQHMPEQRLDVKKENQAREAGGFRRS